MHKEKKENEGKYVPNAECDSSPAEKEHRKTEVLNVLFASVTPGTTLGMNPRLLRSVAKSGSRKTYTQ